MTRSAAPRDALDAFDRTRADPVLLDLMLSGAPGTEGRSLWQRSDVPVVMLSAKDTEVDKAVSVKLGADDYASKPCGQRFPCDSE